MHNRLGQEWERLEEVRREYQQYVRQLSSAQLSFKPDADSWSIQQVLRHIISVDQLSATQLMKSGRTKHRKSTLGTRFRSEFLRLMLKSPIKFKVPPIPDLQPAEEQDISSLLEEWKASRQKLKQFLENFPEDKLALEIYRHPRSGWLTLVQALQFMGDHLRHHQQQLKRISKAPAYPA